MTEEHLDSEIMKTGKKLTNLRKLIQLVFFILTLSVGLQFYLFVVQAGSGNSITIPRPEGVEAFLPIGGLMGWKYYLSTGIWDTIHPASMIFILFAAIISFLFRKAFCSWICPIGTLSEWLWNRGLSLHGKNFILKKWIDIPLRGVKYLILFFFLFIILKMTSTDINAFFNSPYYRIADVKMLRFFTGMTILSAIVISGLTILSVFFRNFWCRYACPYGALLGLFACLSPSRIERNEDNCTNCGKCHKVCAFHLPIDKKKQILSPECSGCMDCVEACPSPGTLKMKIKSTDKTISVKQAALWVIILFWGIVYLATITGHWKSSLSANGFRMYINRENTFMKAGSGSGLVKHN